MRRWWTWLVVAAVAGVSLAATVDTLRGVQTMTHAAAPATTAAVPARKNERAISELRESGVTGVITYADEDCHLHAMTLPDLEPVHASSIEMCEPFPATGGISAFGGDVVWSGLGYHTVQVVLSKEELTAALEHRVAPGPYRAHQVAWLRNGRYAVLAQGRGRGLVAIFAHERLSALAALGLGPDAVVRPSPEGRYIAVLGRGLSVTDQTGRGVTLPDVHPHAIAWSPDEQWTALATRSDLFVFPTGRTGGPLVRIPLAVRDLAWEGAE